MELGMTVDGQSRVDVLNMTKREKQLESQVPVMSAWRQDVWYKQRISQTAWKIISALLLFLFFCKQILQTIRVRTLLQQDSTILPSYILEYAPVVYLDEQEEFFPADLSAQVANTTPLQNFTTVLPENYTLTLQDLHNLNVFGDDVFLTSDLDVTLLPSYLFGVSPSLRGHTPNATSSVIIAVSGPDGQLDAFYMYFYAYNRGNTVFGRILGDHVGDWEHNMIRFKNGVPQAIWYSQHNNGEAFTYEAVEKVGVRPVMYSARGSHACYATSGIHDHTIPDLNLPNGFVRDYTSSGPLWDPLLSTYFYKYDVETEDFAAADKDRKSPLGAMYFKGKWGDEEYPPSDSRQSQFFGFRRYVSGPTGPFDKYLDRKLICPDNGFYCFVRERLGP